jgi:hypothetical protein
MDSTTSQRTSSTGVFPTGILDMNVRIQCAEFDIVMPDDFVDKFLASPWRDDGIGHKERKLVSGEVELSNYAYYCASCKTEFPPIFMVKDELWRKYGNGHGILCFICFEQRLGRDIRIEDLTDAPCNRDFRILLDG